MSNTPWADLTPEQKRRDVQDHKRRKYLRETGRPSLVPVGPARRKLLALRQVYAISSRDMAVGSGVCQSTVSDLIRGHRSPAKNHAPITKIPRRTHDLVMAYEPDPALYNPCARVDVTGSRRRLQALACRGYSTVQMAEFMGSENWNAPWRIMRGLRRDGGSGASFVEAKTRDAIAGLYVKYIDTDPRDVGGSTVSIGRATGAARRNGYSPAHCWDADTIDDPDAFPEWTGECGTPQGYYLHLKYGIRVEVSYDAPGRKSADGSQRRVACQPCVTARSHSAGSVGIRPGELAVMDALKDGVLSRRAIAAEFGVSTRTVYRVAERLTETGWKSPTSGPRPGSGAKGGSFPAAGTTPVRSTGI